MSEEKKWQRKMNSEETKVSKKSWRVIYIVLVAACIACIFAMMFCIYCDRKEDEAAITQHEELVEQVTQDEAEPEVALEDSKAELPIDFEALQEINPEIYAWIRIPDTNIDYPVLQRIGEDQDYYLNHDIYGEVTQAGSIYTESYNAKGFQDPNTILYGHNMKNGSMFHNVRYFAEQEYFDAHEELYIYMPEKILKYRIIACYEIDDRHLMGKYDFMDEEVYAAYLEEIMNPRSMYAMIREGVELTTEDKLVTLSTCIANKPNNRRVLQAVLLEEIEAEYRGIADENAGQE